MKNKYIGIITSIFAAGTVSAQVVNDSVSVAAGYVNQSYYSLESGEVSTISNNDWDLAFDTSPFGATIRINRRIETIYVAPIDTAAWASLDTAGYASWDEYANGFQSWVQGALNAPANPAVAEDLGWGIYSTITHATNGNRIFLVKQSDGTFNKLWIKKLASGTYTFVHANLDNTETENVSILKADYSSKNFVYYELSSATIIDREPVSLDWDLVLTNYVDEIAPGMHYGVTGVLSNNDTPIFRSSEVLVTDATYIGGDFTPVINTIGYDWKSFNMETFSYDIADSLCYFIQTQAGDVWKVIFTGFNGSADGKMYFSKEKIETASIEMFENVAILCYPNPANNILTISAMGEDLNQIELYNTNGQRVYVVNGIGSSNNQLDVSGLADGIYFLQVETAGGNTSNHRIVIAH